MRRLLLGLVLMGLAVPVYAETDADTAQLKAQVFKLSVENRRLQERLTSCSALLTQLEEPGNQQEQALFNAMHPEFAARKCTWDAKMAQVMCPPEKAPEAPKQDTSEATSKK